MVLLILDVERRVGLLGVVVRGRIRDRGRDRDEQQEEEEQGWGVEVLGKRFPWTIWRCRMGMVVGLSRRRRMWLILSLLITRDLSGLEMGLRGRCSGTKKGVRMGKT